MPILGRQTGETLPETLVKTRTVYTNLTAGELTEHALKAGTAKLSKNGALVVETGEHTGRSANDKFIVKDRTTEGTIDWGKVNQPMTTEQAEALFTDVMASYDGQDLYVQDSYAGADADYGIGVRTVSPSSWHTLFAQNMFIDLQSAEYEDFSSDFTIYHAPEFTATPEKHGTNSDTFIVIDFTNKRVMIGGTSYAGEIKKSIFTVLNYVLPEQGVFPMHCSANVDNMGNAAVFFGLSGTGKTTLSADSSRTLVGDDEHGWSTRGLFNFEGGCYAKTIRLSANAEPEIYATTQRFGTILENVVMDDVTRELDLDDASLTENTRASYPLEFIPNASATGTGPTPKDIVMLTADAFGVLPPISRLDTKQALYHFLSGYTAKIAGTEKGLGDEPVAAFSACFGAPFMPRHPVEYAKLMADKMEETGARCWLVNTGWTGGAYGTGERMPIAYTRAMLRAALNGELETACYTTHSVFGLSMPTTCPGVPNNVLNPMSTWKDKSAYMEQAKMLQDMFEENFEQFEAKFQELMLTPLVRAA